MSAAQIIQSFLFLLIATIVEVSGDAIVRKALFDYVGAVRIGFLFAGGILLLGYGLFLNLAPVPFERVVGLYIATLFVVWQVMSYFAFRTLPSVPILLGGSMVIAGGAIITFWQPSA